MSARNAWLLVQIFPPGVAAFGAAKYYELILERETAAQSDSSVAFGIGEQHEDWS